MPFIPEIGASGFRFLFIGFTMLVFLLIRRQWRYAAIRRDEVIRLVALAAEESSYVTEIRSTVDYSSVSDVYRCAVCLYPTTTRCSQCKSVRYCSSKCQILHWRRGHKEECRSPSLPESGGEQEKSDDAKESNIEFESSVDMSANGLHGMSVDAACDVSRSRSSIQKVKSRSEAADFTSSLNKKDDFYETRALGRKKLLNRAEKVESARKYSKSNIDVLADVKPKSIRNQSSHRSAEMSNPDQFEGETNALGHGRIIAEPSTSSAAMPSSTSYQPSNSQPKVSQASSSGLKTSVQKVVQHCRPPKSSKLAHPSSSIAEMSFLYEML